jgi:ATP-dependent Lhr-like helicase
MVAPANALAAFHPASQAWFMANLGEPTPPQRDAWPAIMAGRHTLIAAPTGSGKTLAAFYVAIDRLLKDALQAGQYRSRTTVLYVSPLKALGNDIQRNLQLPLAGIADLLPHMGLPAVDIRVAVRTGDTPQRERQGMLKKPPHILVTTPESLYLLLTSKGGRQMLSTVNTVILDEIHAMLGDKRGSHLSLSLERLQNLVPHPLQRIGLSATQKPIERVAQYLVGMPHIKEGRTDCVIVDSGHQRQLDVTLEVPGSPLTALMSNDVWGEIYQRLEQLTASHRTTIIFVNTRRLAERLALTLGERIGAELVSSHHGSMSKDHRFDAEQRLKNGQLRVLVATASMELGIDVGAVELVVQIASPKGIAAFLQRVGRSRHQVGGVPKGVLFPLTRDDLVECTALLDSIRRGELDQLVIPDKPLDILAQQLVAELGSFDEGDAGCPVETLWQWVTRSWVYRDLTRAEFDGIVRMLAEGYSTRRGRGGALLHLDQINGMARPRKGARLTALTNGGAIPDMFDYQVVLDPDDMVVGSIHEDFALESLPGDIFTLGNHSWRMLRIDGLKVRVTDAQGQPPTIPFWLGEGPGRTRELSQAVSQLRATLYQRFDDSPEPGTRYLKEEVGLSHSAAEQLANYLYSGSTALGVMPTRECLVLERFFDEVGDMHIVLHSPFGSRVNKAWGLALRKRFCRSFNFELQAAANEDSIVISLGSVHSFELAEVFDYLQSSSVEDVLVQALLDAPMFEVRWRWNTSRALAVARNRNGKRIPPQFQRMAAEDFVAQVFPDQIACQENLSGPRAVPDHPLVQQTIHDCLTEAMNLPELKELIRAIETRQVQLVARDLREPSPFAQEIINAKPYAFLDDAPFEERRTLAIRNRSWVDPAENSDYSALDILAIQRVREEAWPWIRSADELHDALMLMGFMTMGEIHGQTEARGAGSAQLELEADLSLFLEELRKQKRATEVRHGNVRLWIASERQSMFTALGSDWHFHPPVDLPETLQQQEFTPEAALTELLRGRLEALGPVTAQQLATSIGMSKSDVEFGLRSLEVEGFAFQGLYTPLTGDTQATAMDKEWCERRLLHRIHRYTIDAHRESIKPVSLQIYLQYLFALHEVQPLSDDISLPGLANVDGLRRILQQLDGITAPATAWESDILPVRLPHYDPAWLDQLCVSGQISWGRLLQPREAASGSKLAGPVKNTPLNLVQRRNLDLWQALAVQAAPETEQLSSAAALLKEILTQHGASFFTDLTRLSALMPIQAEQALAELVSLGLVTSDNFTGLRALLTPDSHKPKLGSHERRRAIYGIEDAGRWSLLQHGATSPQQPATARPEELSDEHMQRLIQLYFARWGVISRKVLEREQNAPSWRQLLLKLRRLELRGEVRGGRFIAGVGGEQFALADTVTALRKQMKQWQEQQEMQTESAPHKPVRHIINATDPLNLLGTLLPEKRVPHLSGNRILFEDGLPVAVLEKDEVKLLRNQDSSVQWELQKLLQRRTFPPRLRAYIGKV